jgi:hypothetical protein
LYGFKCIYSYAVSVFGRCDGTDLTYIHIENCYFDAGSSYTLHEHILTNAVKKVTLRNSVFLGNKMAYLSAERVDLDHVYENTMTLTED